MFWLEALAWWALIGAIVAILVGMVLREVGRGYPTVSPDESEEGPADRHYPPGPGTGPFNNGGRH